jgi:hypothetical protein
MNEPSRSYVPTLRRLVSVLPALALLTAAEPASAGPWTRDRGHAFVSLAYSRIAADRVYGADFSAQALGATYEQHALQAYAEVGLIDRYLTASFESQLLRYNTLINQGATYGLGDMRLGFWSGLVTAPVRLSAAFLVGIPSGDPSPFGGGDDEAALIARSLPTGDGEVDFEPRLSLGYSFGGVRRWPLLHYAVIEAGYWIRTSGRSRDPLGRFFTTDFADAFTYRGELGTKLPFPFVERFWIILRMMGVESFATQLAASFTCATGLGNGVTYNAYGVEIAGRIVRGLGANLGVDGAFRARCVAAAPNLKVGLTYEF